MTAPPLPPPAYRRSKRSSQPSAPVSSRPPIRLLAVSLFWLMVISAMLACLVQMARKPDAIPAVVGVDTAAARETLTTLKELGESTKPTSWTVNSQAINQYLESSIDMVQSPDALPGVRARFQRTFIRLRKDSFDLYIDQKFLGVNIYFLVNLKPERSGAGLGLKVTGGGIGRLPIHPALTPTFLRLFEPVISGLSQPLKILKTARAVTITPEDATLQWAGTGNTP